LDWLKINISYCSLANPVSFILLHQTIIEKKESIATRASELTHESWVAWWFGIAKGVLDEAVLWTMSTGVNDQ
jgi:hypothetical protein